MKWTYKKAGVDIQKAEEALEKVLPLIQRTYHTEVLEGAGGFAAVVAPRSLPSGATPLLVTCTDGVGTKIEILHRLGKNRVAGWDAVAMCVNDLVTTGARPFLFLDYFASSVLQPSVYQEVLHGLSDACLESGCALVGGETAELPGFFPKNLYDVVGFAIGLLDPSQWIQPQKSMKAGDRVVGLPSSGVHSNGFSLIRRILKVKKIPLSSCPPEFTQTLGDVLSTPTRIYVPAVLEVLRAFYPDVHGLAHITGGGMPDNISRILPRGLGVHISLNAFDRPAIFQFLQSEGEVEPEEMLHTFNMGVGMVLLVEASRAEAIRVHCEALLGKAWLIGEVVAHEEGVKFLS